MGSCDGSLLKVDSVAADMLATAIALALFSCLHAAPLDKSLQKGGVHAIASNLNKHADMPTALGEGGAQPIAERVMGGDEAEDPAAADAGSDMNLLEDEDEAIGDRIMEDMNGMKDKFDTALKRIGDEIDKDQAEQDEKNAGS